MSIEEIHEICSKHNITNYTINDDMSIDVYKNVYLNFRNLKELPLNFRHVLGDFNCSHNLLTSLEGAPSSVDGFFDCSLNNLKSLEGAPSSVGGYFDCYYNILTSLEGIPLNLSEKLLNLQANFTYNDYLTYCKVVERDFKFKKILK